jgi:2-oxoglutarate ferredoxin oxidoreductase subunit beta
VSAAGAVYVARYLVSQSASLISSTKKALETEGFSFVEAISPCPTQFGRRNRLDTPKDLLRFVEEKCISKEEAEGLSSEELEGKIITGEFSHGRG